MVVLMCAMKEELRLSLGVQGNRTGASTALTNCVTWENHITSLSLNSKILSSIIWDSFFSRSSLWLRW